jgi:hypothetical protein
MTTISMAYYVVLLQLIAGRIVVLEKLIIAELLKTFPAFYGL